MQNKFLIALLGTLGFNVLTPSLASHIEATYQYAAPNWFLVFAGIFTATFIAEKAYGAYVNYKK